MDFTEYKKLKPRSSEREDAIMKIIENLQEKNSKEEICKKMEISHVTLDRWLQNIELKKQENRENKIFRKSESIAFGIEKSVDSAIDFFNCMGVDAKKDNNKVLINGKLYNYFNFLQIARDSGWVPKKLELPRDGDSLYIVETKKTSTKKKVSR